MSGERVQTVFQYYRGICRCCLTCGYLRSLTQEYADETGCKKIFSNIFLECFREELVPSDANKDAYLICETCIQKLEESDSFRRQVSEAHKHFKRLTTEGRLRFDALNFQVKLEADQAENGLRQVKVCPTTVKMYDFRKKIKSSLKLSTKTKKSPSKKKIFKTKVVTGSYHTNDGISNYSDKSDVTCHGESLWQGAKVPYKNITQEKVVQNRKHQTAKERTGLPYSLEAGNLTCVICGQHFFSSIILNSHMNIHYPNFICDICGKGFAIKSRLGKHLSSHVKSAYPCKLCDRIYSTYKSHYSHVRQHHGAMTYRCTLCRVRFATYDARLQHLVGVHGEEPRRHRCSLCQKAFMRAGTLSVHMRTVHLKEKTKRCEVCGAAFFTKSTLDNHMACHSDKKDHLCHICHKAYTRRKTLLAHLKIHKKKDNSKAATQNNTILDRTTV